MTSLLATNKFGYKEAVWKYIVKGGQRRRAWYVRRKARTLGQLETNRRQWAQQVSETDNLARIEPNRGFRVFEPSFFPEIPDIVADTQRIVSEKDKTLAAGNKSFLKEGFLPANEVTLDSSFMRFALREDLLRAITSYLGVVPVLKNVDVWKSDATPGKDRASQLYHCDWDDLTQIKIFIYASEVDFQSGPLTLLDARDSEILKQHVGYGYSNKKYRIKDDTAEQLLGSKASTCVTGVTGTTVLADTSRCFHFGSRVLEGGRPRLVAHYQFVTPTSFLFPPMGYQDASPYQDLANDSHSELQRMVLGVA